MSAEAANQPIFLLRVDCEHVESRRRAGSAEPEVAGTPRLLALLAELDVQATFAFVGLTAREYPQSVRAAVAGGHAIAGHSMDHAEPYAGRPRQEQEADMEQMVAAIEATCGVRVRGLATPCHGLIDGATLEAAWRNGLDYVLNFSITAEAPAPLAPAPGMEEIARPALVPSAHLNVVWDWTHLQPGWPPFSTETARPEWQAAIDRASHDEGGAVGLIIHPWIVELNQEYAVLAEILGYARENGFTFSTFDAVASKVLAHRLHSVTATERA
jgi:peptidoglycan/xylan/chitin deacetylase (PgdA/CDA1 family)